MIRFILTLLFISISWFNNIYAQYRLDSSAKILEFEDVRIFRRTFHPKMKLQNNQLYVYNQIDTSTYCLYHISLPNLEIKDTIHVECKQNIRDFYIDSDLSLLYIAENEIFKIKNGRLTSLQKSSQNTDIRGFISLSSKSLYAYDLYPYHPFDSKAGLYIYKVDNKHDIIRSGVKVPFEGISIANIVNQWVEGCGNKIYIVEPLTGKLRVYNDQIKLLDSVQLEIPELSVPKNAQYIRDLDSQMYAENNKLLEDRAKGLEYVPTPFYSKDGIINKINNLRKNFSYIEKIIALNDSTLLFTIYQPEYEFNYRDVIVYNARTKNIEKRFNKWRCNPSDIKDTISKIEDYFTIDIINNNLTHPIFYKNHIYYFSKNPIDEFEYLKPEELDNKFYKLKRQRNIYKYYLCRYEINYK